MGTDEFRDGVERTVWASSGKSRLLTVTGLLAPGKYEIHESTNSKGNTVLEFQRLDE